MLNIRLKDLLVKSFEVRPTTVATTEISSYIPIFFVADLVFIWSYLTKTEYEKFPFEIQQVGSVLEIPLKDSDRFWEVRPSILQRSLEELDSLGITHTNFYFMKKGVSYDGNKQIQIRERGESFSEWIAFSLAASPED